MKVLLKKEKITDENSMEITILADTIAAHIWEKLNKIIEEKFKLEKQTQTIIDRKYIDKLLTAYGICNLANAVTIGAGEIVESDNTPIGTIYFNKVKNKFRIKTKEGFKTIKLED